MSKRQGGVVLARVCRRFALPPPRQARDGSTQKVRRRRWRPVAAGAALAAVLSWLAPAAAQAAFLEAICSITFSGASGLGPWTGRVPDLRIRPTPSANAGRWDAMLEIPVASLDDGNKVRDARMHEMFESRQWPTIRVKLRDVDPAEAERSARLAVELTIREQTQRLDAMLSNWRSSGGRTEFEADLVVSLQSFSLEAPTMLGLSKVDDEVRIHARVLVASAGSDRGGR